MVTAIDTYTPIPGERLPNGALVIAARIADEDNLNKGYVVLAIKNSISGHEYITWYVSARDGESFWGNYFRQDAQTAFNNYLAR